VTAVLFSTYILTDMHRYAGVEGTGNLEGCMRDIQDALAPQKAECIYPMCLLDGVPYPTFGGTIVATENFARVVQILHLGADASIADIETRGLWFCGLPWLAVAEVCPIRQ
jgi:hypothetical protein